MQVNDMAAMREACQNMCDLFERGVICTSYANTAEETWQIEELYRKAKAALAEPPRNCDRFGGDIEELREACLRERGLNPEEDFPDVFPDWLLALSTAKEGGAS